MAESHPILVFCLPVFAAFAVGLYFVVAGEDRSGEGEENKK